MTVPAWLVLTAPRATLLWMKMVIFISIVQGDSDTAVKMTDYYVSKKGKPNSTNHITSL